MNKEDWAKKIIKNWRGTYRLDENKNAIPCSTIEWGDQIEEMSMAGTKHVAEETICGKWISTVWLGLTRGFDDNEKPLLYETMIHDKEKDEWLDYEERYSTWDEAVKGHEKAVQWVKDVCKEDEERL